jgi:hypothetical protein
MPKGPQGQKRPADVIGNAVHVMRIATGEAEDDKVERDPRAVTRGRLGGKKGGLARSKALSDQEKRAIAKKAAKARWK